MHLDGVPGVWFFSLDASNTLAVLGARLAFHLPYFKAHMRLERRGRAICFTSRRTHRRAAPAEFKAFWTVGDELGRLGRVHSISSSSNATVSILLTERGSFVRGSSTIPGPCIGQICSLTARR